MMKSPFEGELVRLRAREPEDEPLLHAWFNDVDVTEHLSIRYPLSHAQEKAFIEANNAPSFAKTSFTIETLAAGKAIGGIGLEQASPENRGAVLGIAIGDKEYWNGGYGTDAMRVMCRFGFEMMNLHRIQLDVYPVNERAVHVYEKLGFQHEGRLRQASDKFGVYRDLLVMGLLRGELR